MYKTTFCESYVLITQLSTYHVQFSGYGDKEWKQYLIPAGLDNYLARPEDEYLTGCDWRVSVAELWVIVITNLKHNR